jgi:hypothetical protein
MTLYIDRLKIDSKIRNGPNGAIIVDAYLTRVGVFDYGPDNQQFRSEEEVFNPDSLESLNNCALTIDHPIEQEITPDNYKENVVGHVINGTVKREGDFIKASLLINDKQAIELVKSKKMRELSAGYFAIEQDEQGIFRDKEYNKRQTNIRYNHLSIVDKGRAGPECQIHLDSKLRKNMENENQDNKELIEKKIDAELEKEEPKKVEPAKDLSEEMITIKKSDLSKKIADKLKRIDQAKRLKNDLDMGVAIELEDRDLMEAVVSEVLSGFDATDKSDDYVEGVFDALLMGLPAETEAAVEEVAVQPETVDESKTEEEEEVKTDSKDSKDSKVVQIDSKKSKSNAIKSTLFRSQPAPKVDSQITTASVLDAFNKSLESAWKTSK